MTVKGMHSLEGLAAHAAPQKLPNGSAANPHPPLLTHAKDANLNLYRDKVVPVSTAVYD